MIAEKTTLECLRAERRRSFWRLAGILLVAAVLRCVDLDGRTMWCDELLSIRRASGTIGHLVDELLKVEHVPLYELSLSFWLRLGRTDAWIRLLSSLYGIATVGVVYLSFLRLTSRGMALGVALFTAVSPLHVYWSRIARPYALLPLAAWAATYFMLRLLEERRRSLWVGYVLAAALCLYTHYFGVLLLAAHNVLFLAHHLGPKRRRLLPWAASQVAIMLLFSPWLVGNFVTAACASAEQQYYASQAGSLVKLPYFFFVFSLGWTVYPLNWWLVVPGALLYGWAFVHGALCARRGPQARAVRTALVLFGIPLLTGILIPACSPKHQVPGLPAYVFIVLCALWQLRRGWLRYGLLLGILVLNAASLSNYFRNKEYTDIDVVIPWREIVSVVEEHSAQGDGIVLGYNPEPFVWYYRGQLPMYKFGDEDFADRRRCDALLRRHGRLWLLLFKDDPREEMEAWMEHTGQVLIANAYQYEEETLRGLRRGFRHVHDCRAHYYKLYLVEARLPQK